MSIPTLHRISFRDGYYLAIRQSGHEWRYPIKWSRAEFEALRMLGGSRMKALNLELGGSQHVPRDVKQLHELIESLFDCIIRLAARAERMRAIPDSPPFLIPPVSQCLPSEALRKDC